MTEGNLGAHQTGKEHVKAVIDGVEYLVDEAGNIYTSAGEFLGTGQQYLGEKWTEFLNTDSGAYIKSAYNWTVDGTGNVLSASGNYIAGVGEGIYASVWGVKPVVDGVSGIFGGISDFFGNAFKNADTIVNSRGFGNIIQEKGLKGALLEKNDHSMQFMSTILKSQMPEMQPLRNWILTGTDADAVAIRRLWQNEIKPYLTSEPNVVDTHITQPRDVEVITEGETQDGDALKVTYRDPITGVVQNKYLTSAQLQMVRHFAIGQKDAGAGYKLKVVRDGTTTLSPYYYYNGGLGTNYYRVGDQNKTFLNFDATELTLTESEYHAAATALYELDIKNNQLDVEFVNVINGRQPAAFSSTAPTLQPNPAQPTNAQQPAIMPTDYQNAGAGLPGTPQPKEDDRNFFLSAANWIDKSLFGSIADLMPIAFLQRMIQMIGNCFSGLFRTIGYLCEGEYSKAFSTCIGWVKDTAVAAGIAYGAYYVSKKVKGLFGNDDNSVASTLTDSLTTSTTTKTDTYVGLKHSALEGASSLEDFNATTPIVAKPDMTEQLDRFATTGTHRSPDDDGTLWRVQVGKSSSTRKS